MPVSSQTFAPYTVPLAENGRELLQRGTPLFPCSIYHRDIRQYMAGAITPHWHREMELFVLETGSVRLILPDRDVTLSPGDGYFANSNVLHGLFCGSGDACRYRSMVFDPTILSGAPGSAFDSLYIRPFTEKGMPACVLKPDLEWAGAVLSLFDAAFSACENEWDGYEFLVRNALSQIFLLLKAHLPAEVPQTAARQDSRIKEMLSWLDLHYGEPVTVSQLAAASGVCVRECQKTFAARLHLSPMQYLARRRIAAAAERLEYSDLPVGEIAISCGFDSPSYFSRQFREMTGLTPREYRRSKRSP